MSVYFAALDLGQLADYSALAILRRVDPPVWEETSSTVGRLVWRERRLAQDPPPVTWHLVHLERWRGRAYTAVIDAVKKRLDALGEGVTLCLDYTGVGVPCFDMARERGLTPYGITIHGGDRVTREGQVYHVPKRDLVGTVQIMLQNGTLRIAENLPERETLQRELGEFRVKIDPATAHDTYSSWREKAHDDLVLSVALAAWLGQNLAGTVQYAPSLWT